MKHAEEEEAQTGCASARMTMTCVVYVIVGCCRTCQSFRSGCCSSGVKKKHDARNEKKCASCPLTISCTPTIHFMTV
jgi:hypothetical protein